MSKLDTIKQKLDVAEDLARQIWLAGLGAYGKSIDEVQGRYEKLNTQASETFNELVEKGKGIESSTKDKIVEKTAVDQRVADVRKKLGLDSSETDKKIEELSAKVDALTEAVAKLAK